MLGAQLHTTSADPKLITGTYTLLLYGCHYPEQIDNVAILVDKNSKYPLEIYDIKTSYSVENEVLPSRRSKRRMPSYGAAATEFRRHS
jgi:hypothetical protein